MERDLSLIHIFICYVETIEPSDNPDTINQKVVLTQVNNEWKVVEVPMK